MKAKNRAKSLVAIAAGLLISTEASAFINHTVQRGETLWGLSHKYSVSADDIIRFNPAVKNGLKTGHTIRIPEASDLDASKAEEAPQETKNSNSTSVGVEDPAVEESRIDGYTPSPNYQEIKTYTTTERPKDMGTDRYVARFGDTFRSVSVKTGVDELTLLALNPMVDGSRIPEGEVIRLTDDAPYTTTRENLSTVDSIVYRVSPVEKITNTGRREATVALMLPFELSQGEVSRQALLATDFYKGFLLATKDSNRNINYDLRIYAVDTSDDSATLEKSLQTLADEGVKVVIPPDDEHQTEEIEKFCNENGIMVLNVLNIKDEGYQNYPNVLQCNISQKLMYDKAIQALKTFYPEYTPVILDLAGGKDEKSGFTNELKSQYRSQGETVREITFTDLLKDSDLETLQPDKKYILIPKSGSQDVFDKISDAIAAKIESDPYPERIKLFGYPDWVALRGASEEELHRIGAVIYSRFNYQPSDAEESEIQAKFRQWYGTAPIEAFPSQGTLGYDAGNALLKMLGNGWPENATERTIGSHSGKQSTFRFVQQPGGGMINDSLYIIEFTPGTGTYTRVI